MIDKPYNVIYLPEIILDENKMVIDIRIRELNDLPLITEVYNKYLERPDIYSVKHWFNKLDFCKCYVDLLKVDLYKLNIIDYYAFKYNIRRDIAKLNYRTLQKTNYKN